MKNKILILSGDGIGPEIIAEAEKVLDCLHTDFGLELEVEQGLVGGAAYEAEGHPLPESTLSLAHDADAILLGSVGGTKWETLDRALRPLWQSFSTTSSDTPYFLEHGLGAAAQRAIDAIFTSDDK